RTGRASTASRTAGALQPTSVRARYASASKHRRPPARIPIGARAHLCAINVTLAANEQKLIHIFRILYPIANDQLSLEAQSERHEHPVVPPHRALALMREPPHGQVREPR